MNQLPIFIGYTRSFWLGIVPTILTILDIVFSLFASGDTASPVAAVMAWGLSFFMETTPEQVTSAMRALAPLYALIIAQQRSGAARPYSMKPRDK